MKLSELVEGEEYTVKGKTLEFTENTDDPFSVKAGDTVVFVEEGHNMVHDYFYGMFHPKGEPDKKFALSVEQVKEHITG